MAKIFWGQGKREGYICIDINISEMFVFFLPDINHNYADFIITQNALNKEI